MTERRRTAATVVVAAVAAYLPNILSSPGRGGADTKS